MSLMLSLKSTSSADFGSLSVATDAFARVDPADFFAVFAIHFFCLLGCMQGLVKK
jgi:Mlc titration factor MtfA (ptsG expression regulator)